MTIELNYKYSSILLIFNQMHFFIVLGHNWQFAKISIQHITLIDTFGGRKYPNLADYFKASPNLKSRQSSRHSVITINENVIIDDEF